MCGPAVWSCVYDYTVGAVEVVELLEEQKDVALGSDRTELR